MRIVVVIDSFPQSTFITRHVQGLEADVVAEYWNPREFINLKSKPEFTSLFKVYDGKLITRIIKRAMQVVFGIPRPQWPIAMRRLWDDYVKKRNPDVALAEFAPNGMAALEACRRHGIPLVVHFHGYDASSLLKQKNYVKKLPALFDQSVAIVAVSHKMRDVLINLGCPINKISIIPCGAPVSDFYISNQVSAIHCRFIFVGRLIPMKGPLLLLKAFKRCVEINPDTSLHLIGGGPLLRKAHKYIKTNRLEKKVRILGHVSIERIRDELAESSVLVQSSVTAPNGHFEGGGPPVSIAEAASSGLPCIAFNHGGLPDFIQDGINGYLVPEGDWEALAERMIFLAGSPDIRLKMGHENRKLAELNANTKNQIPKLLQVLANAAIKPDLPPLNVRPLK